MWCGERLGLARASSGSNGQVLPPLSLGPISASSQLLPLDAQAPLAPARPRRTSSLSRPPGTILLQLAPLRALSRRALPPSSSRRTVSHLLSASPTSSRMQPLAPLEGNPKLEPKAGPGSSNAAAGAAQAGTNSRRASHSATGRPDPLSTITHASVRPLLTGSFWLRAA